MASNSAAVVSVIYSFDTGGCRDGKAVGGEIEFWGFWY